MILLLTGCSEGINEEEAAKQTVERAAELDLFVQQTLQSQSEREQSIQQTLMASMPTMPATPIPVVGIPPATASLPAEPASMPTLQNAIEPTPTQSFDEGAFQEWMLTAKILVYEDMTARLETFRYVSTTLDDMGLSYKDDGSAIGWFYDDIETGPQDGGQWDLIIVATEDKNGIKANFFDLALDASDLGSSVILEVWNLNNTYTTSANKFLSTCGLVFEQDLSGIPPSSAMLFPITPGHPILNQPNSGLSFSSPTNQWWDPSGKNVYDVGDLISLETTGDAVLLLGTRTGSENHQGTSAVCLQGKITLQTFSSHIISYKQMAPLWENYIYNALRIRFGLIP